MDITANWNTPDVEVHIVRSSARCAVCNRRAHDSMVALHESLAPQSLDVPGPCQSWLLCDGCAAAVASEIERSGLRTPLRTRIAVGMVAAERRPQRRLTVLTGDYWEQMPAQKLDRLIVGFVLSLFAIPPLFFLIVTVLVVHGGVGP